MAPSVSITYSAGVALADDGGAILRLGTCDPDPVTFTVTFTVDMDGEPDGVWVMPSSVYDQPYLWFAGALHDGSPSSDVYQQATWHFEVIDGAAPHGWHDGGGPGPAAIVEDGRTWTIEVTCSLPPIWYSDWSRLVSGRLACGSLDGWPDAMDWRVHAVWGHWHRPTGVAPWVDRHTKRADVAALDSLQTIVAAEYGGVADWPGPVVPTYSPWVIADPTITVPPDPPFASTQIFHDAYVFGSTSATQTVDEPWLIMTISTDDTPEDVDLTVEGTWDWERVAETWTPLIDPSSTPATHPLSHGFDGAYGPWTIRFRLPPDPADGPLPDEQAWRTEGRVWGRRAGWSYAGRL